MERDSKKSHPNYWHRAEKTRELSAYIRKVLWSYVVEVVTTHVLRPWMGATLISTIQYADKDGHRYLVSMPWKGRHSFLLKQSLRQRSKTQCVNALKGATLISTLMNEINQTKEWLVSMPWKGRPSFPLNLAGGQKLWRCCVNALNGATFISTDIDRTIKKCNKACQCPERGDLHFHPLPPGTRMNKGFADPFLQVFSRIFWKRRFWRWNLACSQFVHIWRQKWRFFCLSAVLIIADFFLPHKQIISHPLHRHFSSNIPAP